MRGDRVSMKGYVRLFLAAAIVSLCLPSGADARNTPRHPRAPCESFKQHGIVSITNVPTAGITVCSYAVMGQTFQFQASSTNGASVLASGPTTGGSCVGNTQMIVVQYTTSRGVDLRASSSSGQGTEVSGTCTISVSRADRNSFSASIDATVVNALAVSCDKLAASGHYLPGQRQKCAEIRNEPRSEHVSVIASIQSV
jgi:hypothetical protein